jgi:hypothetical protein
MRFLNKNESGKDYKFERPQNMPLSARGIALGETITGDGYLYPPPSEPFLSPLRAEQCILSLSSGFPLFFDLKM